VSPEDNWPRAPLPWQVETWQQLLPLVEAATLPHALLVAGPQYVGKRHFLFALGALLLCEDRSAGTACGDCRNCHLLAVGTHPDALIVSTEEDSRVIKIDQIRHLIDFAVRTPAISSRKLILIGPAEAMNTNAANAVLKCLEEPSESTLILLYSHQPSALPATIRSRCQTLTMAPPAAKQSLAWLDQATGSSDISAQLLQVSNQRPLLAMDYFLRDELAQQLALQEGVDALLAGGISALEFPALVAELELVQVLALMQTRLESQLRARVLATGGCGARPGFVLRDELARLQRAVANGANPNRQLTIEDCAARLAAVVGPEVA
jgi:DNA polymerase-3 subunit delta'